MDDETLNLALTVERHHSGSYHWVVVELDPADHDYRRLLESSQNFGARAEAFMAGCAALLKLLTPAGPTEHPVGISGPGPAA